MVALFPQQQNEPNEPRAKRELGKNWQRRNRSTNNNVKPNNNQNNVELEEGE